MPVITADMVKKLREDTNAGIMDCKSALGESEGDYERAKEILREKGIAKAEKKIGRDVNEGVVDAYIHMGGRVGVLIEVNCETDFVAKTDEFKNLVHELCLQIAALAPDYVGPEDVPADITEKEKDIYRKQALESGKPEKIVDKIAEGKLAKFYEQVCLLEQAYIRDDEKRIKDLVKETIAKIGENIKVRRFSRFSLADKK